MYGNANGPKPGFSTFSTPDGKVAGVARLGPHAFSVMGSDGRVGLYTRFGNTVVGPDGKPRMVVGSGPVKTIVGPDGKMTHVRDNGFGGTIF